MVQENYLNNPIHTKRQMMKSKDNQDQSEPITNAPYTLYKNVKNAYELIDEKLFAYNLKCVPATQEPDGNGKYYISKEYLMCN